MLARIGEGVEIEVDDLRLALPWGWVRRPVVKRRPTIEDDIPGSRLDSGTVAVADDRCEGLRSSKRQRGAGQQRLRVGRPEIDRGATGLDSGKVQLIAIGSRTGERYIAKGASHEVEGVRSRARGEGAPVVKGERADASSAQQGRIFNHNPVLAYARLEN